MNDITAPYEYTVRQKIEGRVRLRRTLLVLGYITYVIAIAAVVLIFLPGFVPALAVVPMTLVAIIILTWKYVDVQFEYEIVSGRITFSEIYGNKKRRETAEFFIRDCSLIAPLADSKGRIDSFAPEKTVCALSGDGTPDAYVALYSENGTKCAVYFEATAKALKIFRMYNAPATVMGNVRY